MKVKHLPLLFITGIIAGVTVYADDTPPLDIPGQPGYVTSGLIYPLDRRPTPQCHASTIVSADDCLVAAWFGGTEEKNPDVGIWLSRYENGAWTRPVEVASGVQADGSRFPCWNPVLFKPDHGPLMLFYKVGPDPVRWWGMLMTSGDGGKTWSQPRKLPDHILGPIKNKPVQVSTGYIVCPSSTEDGGWKVHFELTGDLGRTWERTEPVDDSGGRFSAIQPAVIVHGGGVLQALCRSREGVIVATWSKDGGRTWSELSSTVIPNPNSGIDAVTLHDGRHLIVYNHAGMVEGKWGGPRTPLNVAVSRDGRSWSSVLVLENGPGEYSYPAVIQDRDGRVHITYTYRRESIKHVVIDPEMLKADTPIK
ncbi:exo-alpha-sialidase [bacterium]|nr:exo-alpha-sialidase [bacterium]